MTDSKPFLIKTDSIITGLKNEKPGKHYILIEKGKIKEIGILSELRKSLSNINSFEYKNSTALPGLVDGHTHMIAQGTGQRGDDIAKELNISIARLAEFLGSKGETIEVKPTTKISQEQYDKIVNILNKFGTTSLLDLDIDKVLEFLDTDKKNIGGQLNYILLNDIGCAYIEKNFSRDNLIKGMKIL